MSGESVWLVLEEQEARRSSPAVGCARLPWPLSPLLGFLSVGSREAAFVRRQNSGALVKREETGLAVSPTVFTRGVTKDEPRTSPLVAHARCAPWRSDRTCRCVLQSEALSHAQRKGLHVGAASAPSPGFAP